MRLASCGLVLAILGIVFLTSVTQARDEFLEFGENLASLVNGGVATQSSQLGGFVPENAIDDDFGNFTHTQAHADEPDPAWWQVELEDETEISLIVVCNRGDGCCQSRLRDIVVEIRDADGEILFATTDVEDPDPEGILNAENELGNPRSIVVDVEALNGGNPVSGQIVRVNRLPDPDLSGGGGNNDESTVLQIGEVGVFEDSLGCPEEGDSHCLGLEAEGPDGDLPGEWTFTVNADNDSGDLLTYVVRAEHEEGTQVTGSSDLDQVVLNLQFVGKWTVTASVDDSAQCGDEAADAECEPIEIQVEPDPEGDNVALGKPAAQSSQLGGFDAGLAVDGNFGNFHHTSNTQQGPAVWEVDLEDEYEISRIVVHNRGDGCCQARLRDLVVSVHDGSFVDDFIDPEIEDMAEEWVPDVIWEEHSVNLIWQTDEVLDPENQDASPPMIEIELDVGVVGQFVRVTRISDLDTSGGAGNPDDPKVLQMGEVEVFGRMGGGPPPGSILKPGDVNNDGGYNIADAVAHLNFLFGGGALVECFVVADSDPIELSPTGAAILDFNGDGSSNIADAVGSLNRLFGGGDGHVLGDDCAEVEPGCPDNCQ